MKTNWPNDKIISALSARDPVNEKVHTGSETTPDAQALLIRLLAVDRRWGAETGTSELLHAVRPKRRTHRLRVVVSSLTVAGVSIAAAVVALVVGVIVPGSPVRPQPAAAAVLTQAADAAASRPPLPALGPGQYYYQEKTESGPCLATDNPVSPPNPTYYSDEQFQTWVTTNGSGETQTSPTPGAHFLSPQDQAAEGGTVPNGCAGASDVTIPANTVDAGVLALPTNPATLAALFAQGRVNDIGQVAASPPACPSAANPKKPANPCSVASQFDVAVNLLTFPTAPARVGAVLYGILAKLPGVEVIGTQTDALGRSGTAIEDPSSGRAFVLDPATGILLESEMLVTPTTAQSYGLAPGTVASAMTYGPVSVVSGLGTLPG